MCGLALLRTSSFRFSFSFVARAANCCSSTGLGEVVMSRKYWKAWLMVQGGTRVSLVQLLITPEEKKVAHDLHEFISAYRINETQLLHFEYPGCTFIPCSVIANGITHPGQCSSPPRTPLLQSDWQAEHPPAYLWEPTPGPRGCQGRCPDGLLACISDCLGYLCPAVQVWWNDCRNKQTLWRSCAILCPLLLRSHNIDINQTSTSAPTYLDFGLCKFWDSSIFAALTFFLCTPYKAVGKCRHHNITCMPFEAKVNGFSSCLL